MTGVIPLLLDVALWRVWELCLLFVIHDLGSWAVSVGRFMPEKTPSARQTDVAATRYFSALASNRTPDSPVTQPTD